MLLRGLAPRNAPAIALQIKTIDLDLFRLQTIQGAVADLRRPRLVQTNGIDGPRSVTATVAAGGYVKLVQATRPTLPEHLLLVDLAGTDDILGTLAELITERLRAGQVRVERFDYQGDPRHLRRINEQGVVVGAVDLETLRGLCPDHRLVILSDATSFSEANGERMRRWVDQLRAWSEVALVMPVPAAQWGPRERALVRLGFRVVEATPRGIGELAQQFRTELPQERATPGGALPPKFDQLFAADPYRWLGDRSPAPSEITSLITEIEAVLGPYAFLYFAALAVFPSVHPKLALALGRVLSDGEGLPLLTENNLLLLCRMPWLRRGRIPDWLRLALVRNLATRPQEAERVRSAWTVLLTPQEEGETTTLPIDVVRKVEPGLPHLVARLIKRERYYREAILIAFLNCEALPELAMELPQRLADMLRGGTPRTDWVVLVCGVVTAGFVAVFLRPIEQAVNTMVASILAPTLIAFLNDALPIAGMALGALALVLWYARFVAGRLAVSGASVSLLAVPRTLILAVALGSCLALLSSSLFNALDSILLGRILLVVLLVAWCSEMNDEGALGWVPLLVLMGLFSRDYEVMLFYLMAPFIAWLTTRHRWPELRQMFWYIAPAMILPFPLTTHIQTLGDGAILLGLVWLAHFLSDHDYHLHCIKADAINWRETAVLFLPLTTSFWIYSSSYFFDLKWSPSLPSSLVWLLLGFTQARPRKLLIILGLYFLEAIISIFMNYTTYGYTPFSHTIIFPGIMWLPQSISMLMSFICGRLMRRGTITPRSVTPYVRWLLIFFSLFPVMALKIQLSSSPSVYSLFSYRDTLCLPATTMVIAATASLLLPRSALWRSLVTAFVAQLIVMFSYSILIGKEIALNEYYSLHIRNISVEYALTLLLPSVLCAWVAPWIRLPTRARGPDHERSSSQTEAIA